MHHTGNEVTSDGLWTYLYDAAGNLTDKISIEDGDYWVYEYDYRNQLAGAAHYDDEDALLMLLRHTWRGRRTRLQRETRFFAHFVFNRLTDKDLRRTN